MNIFYKLNVFLIAFYVFKASCGIVPYIKNGKAEIDPENNITAILSCNQGYVPTKPNITCVDSKGWEKAVCEKLSSGNICFFIHRFFLSRIYMMCYQEFQRDYLNDRPNQNDKTIFFLHNKTIYSDMQHDVLVNFSKSFFSKCFKNYDYIRFTKMLFSGSEIRLYKSIFVSLAICLVFVACLVYLAFLVRRKMRKDDGKQSIFQSDDV